VAAGIAVYITYTKYQIRLKLTQNYVMCTLKLSSLPKTSPTRQRLAAAQEYFEDGWKVCCLHMLQ
jgi:hypothetical protein